MIYSAAILATITVIFVLIIVGARSDDEWVEWQR